MSNFPSLQNVIDSTKKTVSKFPLEIVVAICGTVFAILLSEEKNDPTEEYYVKIIMSLSLCLVMFLSSTLYFATNKTKNWIRLGSSFLLGSLLFGFVFNFGNDIKTTEVFQFLVLNIALHLLVSFASFITKPYKQDEFWEFNKQLFLRIITGGIYSFVLFSGLSLAILAVTNLFDIRFYDTIYAHLFFVISGIFNTIFFLAGIPETNDLEHPLELSYPKGLKNFTQYVLLPLISIYLVILICYESKILITLSLPVGWVSYLVLVFSIIGILSFLLVHPIAKEIGNLWIRNYNRWFYYLLVPLLFLLFWAILYRINLYGFTHERYYVFVLSIWLAIIVVFFIISNNPKIIFIPISLCLIALLTIIGPQSADSVSKQSQLSRFATYMQLIEKKKLTFKQEQDLSSIIDFLEENYGVEIMIPLTKNKLGKLLIKEKKPSSSQIMETFGLHYRSEYENQKKKDNYFNYNYYENDNQKIDLISGYDVSFKLNNETNLNCSDCISINGKNYSFATYFKDYGLDLKINSDIVPLKIKDFIKATDAFDSNQNRKIIQQIDSEKYQILITYINAYGNRVNGLVKVKSYDVELLVKIKGK